MRLWHKDLIPYLPDLQLKGQWRECALIADALSKNGTPNHLLVNRVMEYTVDEFYTYCLLVWGEMKRRGFTASLKSCERVSALSGKIVNLPYLFDGWHNTEYLRVCMANLYEKHFFGIGKSRITDEEWQVLLDGYKAITGEEYKI
jgi:uncharacterized protein (TIGR02328 family)